MKILLFTIALLQMASFTQAANADSEAAAIEMFEEFLQAMTAADTRTVTGLFSEDALFWGTGSQSLVTNPEGVQAYFGPVGNNVPGETRCRAVDYSTQYINEELALLSGMWEVVPPNQESINLRVSMAVGLRDGEWKILQFHNSSVPE